MSEAFSDDLSDPTPSPPPPIAVRSSTSSKTTAVNANANTRRGSTVTSKANTANHQRTTSTASALNVSTTSSSHTGGIVATRLTGYKGTAAVMAKLDRMTSSASASHSRTGSLANSLVMSQSAPSASGKGTMVNGHAGSDEDEEEEEEEEEENDNEASQSGSDLSSPPSEGEDTQSSKRVITDSAANQATHGVDDEENGDEEGDEDDEKGDEEDDNDDEESAFPYATRPLPRHGRTPSGGGGIGNLPPRATRQSSLRSGSAAAGRAGRGVIPAGMWEWAKKKNSKKPKADKSDDDEDGSDDGDEEGDEDDEGAGVDVPPGDSRDESPVQPRTSAAVGEDEPMINSTTNPHSPNGTFNDSDDIASSHLQIPTVKIEPPPSATMSSFRTQDLAHPPASASVSPAPTPAPSALPERNERRTNGRAKGSTRTNSKRSHRAPPAGKRGAAAATLAKQQSQAQLQAQLQQDAEDDAEAEEVERATREMDVEEGEGDDDDGELLEGDGEGEGEYGNRKDAMDALGLLELKFALVRQRIYQDKMEELGREERLVKDGSHPELLHTYIELDKRKERRTMLAELKRKREIDLAAITRIHDEDAVWSWWMIQKDVVQSFLITENSRKRRRVERERRALLDPLRRTLDLVPPPSEPPRSRDRDGDEDMMPSRPPTKAILAVALRHPYARLRTYNPSQVSKSKLGENPNVPMKAQDTPSESMPTLSQLSQSDINSDLEVLLGYRRGFGEVGVVLNAGASAVPGMPEAGLPVGVAGAPMGGYGPPGTSMDAGMNGTITVNNAAVPPAQETFNPATAGMGVAGGDPAQASGMLDYSRSMHELEQRERVRNRDGQAFNDHLAAHQYSSVGMPPNVGAGPAKGPSNGRERERDRPGTKKYSSSSAPGMGHGSYVGAPAQQQQQQQQQQRDRDRDHHAHGGYPPHPHRQGMDPYASPGLGLQNMQRLPEAGGPRDRDRDNAMVGIQHMPLPPAPSTIPAASSSGASKHHHHHHPVPPAPGHAQTSQHPSLMWEAPRRDRERDRESELVRERSHSTASRNPGMPGSGYAANPGPSSGNNGSVGGVSSSSGRPHSHSVSQPHQHAHYHPTHTHSRSNAQSSTAHSHSHGVLHAHPHAHSHAPGSTSHLHVIHNHGPSPTGNGGNGAPGGSSSSSRRNNAYDEGPPASSGGGHRARPSYPSGSTVDREKELRERERLAGAVPSMNVMHPSLSHGGGTQERDRHSGYAIPHSSRDSRDDRYRVKDRDDRRDRERLDRERQSHSQAGMSEMTGPSGHQQPQQPHQQSGSGSNRGSRSGSITMHPSQGVSYSQGQPSIPGSRYPYGSSSAYSPPATQPSQSRRNSPPSLLPPVPNTSRYGTSSSTYRRASPSPTDPLSYTSSQAQAEIASIHSPTSSLNPPGFNPWSAPLKSSGRPYRPSSPPQKISPPTGIPGTSFNSSAGGCPSNPLPGPTLSPIIPSAVSPAPRPSISPAPRPPSSSSLHAILQPPSRETALSPQPKRSGSGEGAGPMEVDPPALQQQTGFRQHPSLAPLNHEGK